MTKIFNDEELEAFWNEIKSNPFILSGALENLQFNDLPEQVVREGLNGLLDAAHTVLMARVVSNYDCASTVDPSAANRALIASYLSGREFIDGVRKHKPLKREGLIRTALQYFPDNVSREQIERVLRQPLEDSIRQAKEK